MFVIVNRVYNVGKGLMQFVLKNFMLQLSVMEFVVYTQTIHIYYMSLHVGSSDSTCLQNCNLTLFQIQKFGTLKSKCCTRGYSQYHQRRHGGYGWVSICSRKLENDKTTL